MVKFELQLKTKDHRKNTSTAFMFIQWGSKLSPALSRHLRHLLRYQFF
jgi:protein gp37